MNATTLDAMRTSKGGRTSACRICRQPVEAVVNFNMREPAAHGKTGTGPTITSRSVSLCEHHAVELATSILDLYPTR